MRRLRALTIVLALVPAAPATGATVSASAPGECFERGGCAPTTITFEAAPGERNDVTLTPDGVVRDAGARLVAGQRCTQVDEHAVRCATGERTEYTALLGDGDDRARGGFTSARGGAGDDVLLGIANAYGDDGDDTVEARNAAGGAGPDRLTSGDAGGEEGDDTLTGTSGNDSLDGGPGRDVGAGGAGDDLVDDADPEPGADRLDGGAGSDMLNLTRAGTAPLTVDLAAQQTTDGDALAGFENALGSRGDDTLVGDAGANELNGGPGEDHIAGGPGADRLVGSSGFDHFDGGEGDDRIDTDSVGWSFRGIVGGLYGLDAEPEPVACGPGVDVIDWIEGDRPAIDCEGVSEIRLAPFPRDLGRRGIGFRIRCPLALRSRGRCRGWLRYEIYPVGPSRGFARFSVPRRGGLVVLPAASYPGSTPFVVTVAYARSAALIRWVVAAPDRAAR